MRSAMEVLLTFAPSPPPPSPPPALAARPARALLKAKKSPNFFLMFLEGGAAVAEVVVVEAGGGMEEAGDGALVEVKDVLLDGTEEQVTVVMGEVILSDEEEKGVGAERVELDSEGVAWAGFDSSHRPFLQQGAERATDKKRNSVLRLKLQD